MPAPARGNEMPATSAFLEAFADVSAAVESGAGPPEVARATGRALEASVIVGDASGSILAVACASPADEQAVLSEGQVLELRVADTTVGELRYRGRGELPPPALVRYVGTLIGLEVERSRAPERASEAAISSFLRDLLDRKVTDRQNIVARGHELGTDLEQGASVVVARAHPQAPEEGDWRARLLAVVERGARGPAIGALAAAVDWSARDGRPRPGNHDGEIGIGVPAPTTRTLCAWPRACCASSRRTCPATTSPSPSAARRRTRPTSIVPVPRLCSRPTWRR